jgi:hypothetical protein
VLLVGLREEEARKLGQALAGEVRPDREVLEVGGELAPGVDVERLCDLVLEQRFLPSAWLRTESRGGPG